MSKIAFTGGGTVGHVSELKFNSNCIRKRTSSFYIGSKTELNEK